MLAMEALTRIAGLACSVGFRSRWAQPVEPMRPNFKFRSILRRASLFRSHQSVGMLSMSLSSRDLKREGLSPKILRKTLERFRQVRDGKPLCELMSFTLSWAPSLKRCR